MKTIHITHPYQGPLSDKPLVLALGFFDGIHRGHQQVIKTAKKIAQAKGYACAVMSFDRHPSVLFQDLDPDQVKYLSIAERKEDLLAQLGVDLFYLVDFERDFAALSPQSFVDQYIVGLGAKVVVAGFDYTYGKKDIANMQTLSLYARGRFDIVTIPEQRTRFGKTSSTLIRQSLLAGDMDLVNQLLGYTYRFKGKVVPGFGRGGKQLGYPTANLQVDSQVYLPAKGVYIVAAKIGDKWLPGMASIGLNPTFDDVKDLVVEVHIFDWVQDIYGHDIEVAWHHFMRPEKAFTRLQDLIDQLALDEAQARDYFTHHPAITNLR